MLDAQGSNKLNAPSLNRSTCLRVARDPSGSRCLEALLSGSAPPKVKERLLTALTGSFGHVSLTAPGSYLVEACYSFGAAALKEKVRVDGGGGNERVSLCVCVACVSLTQWDREQRDTGCCLSKGETWDLSGKVVCAGVSLGRGLQGFVVPLTNSSSTHHRHASLCACS